MFNSRKGLTILELIITLLIFPMVFALVYMFLGSSFNIFENTNLSKTSYDYLQLLSDFTISQTKSAESLEIFDNVEDVLPFEDGYRYIYLNKSSEEDGFNTINFADGTNIDFPVPSLSTFGTGDYNINFKATGKTDEESILEVYTSLDTRIEIKEKSYSINLNNLISSSPNIVYINATDKEGTVIRYKSNLPLPVPPVLYSVTITSSDNPTYGLPSSTITEPNDENDVNIVLKSNYFIDLSNLAATYLYDAEKITVYGYGDTHPDKYRDYTESVVVRLESPGFLPAFYAINIDIDGDAQLKSFDVLSSKNLGKLSSDKIGDFLNTNVSLYFFNNEAPSMDSLKPYLTFDADTVIVNGVTLTLDNSTFSNTGYALLNYDLDFNYPITVTVLKGPYEKTYTITSYIEPILTEFQYEYNEITKLAKINQATSTISLLVEKTGSIGVKANYIGNSVYAHSLDGKNEKIIADAPNKNFGLKPASPRTIDLSDKRRVTVYGDNGSSRTYFFEFDDSTILNKYEYNEKSKNLSSILNENVFRKKVTGNITYPSGFSEDGIISIVLPQNEFLDSLLSTYKTTNYSDIVKVSDKKQLSEVEIRQNLNKSLLYKVSNSSSSNSASYDVELSFSPNPTAVILNDAKLHEQLDILTDQVSIFAEYAYDTGFNRNISKYRYFYESSLSKDFSDKTILDIIEGDFLDDNNNNILSIPLLLREAHENKYIRIGVQVISDEYTVSYDDNTYGGIESNIVYTKPYFYETPGCPISPRASSMYNNRFLAPNILYAFIPLEKLPTHEDFDPLEIVFDKSKIKIPKSTTQALENKLNEMIDTNDYTGLDAIASTLPKNNYVSPIAVTNLGLKRGVDYLEIIMVFDDDNILPADSMFKKGFPIFEKGALSYPSTNTKESSIVLTLEDVSIGNKNKFALIDYSTNLSDHIPIQSSFETDSGIGVWNDKYIDFTRPMYGGEDYIFYVSTIIDSLKPVSGFRAILNDDSQLPWGVPFKPASNIQFIPGDPSNFFDPSETLIHIVSWHGSASQSYYGSVNAGNTNVVTNDTIMGTIHGVDIDGGAPNYLPKDGGRFSMLAIKKRGRMTLQFYVGDSYEPLLVAHSTKDPFLPSFESCGVQSHPNTEQGLHVYYGDADNHNLDDEIFNRVTFLPIQSQLNTNFDDLRVFVTTFQ